MNTHPPPIRFEEIERIPAARLLELSYSEINDLIRQAERSAHHADTIVHWLRGIKVEKSYRYQGGNHE